MIKTLIVDDEYFARRGMVLTLPWEKYDMTVVGEVDSVQKALDFLEKNEVDVVFTDIAMPGTSGMELANIIHSKYVNIGVVIITCYRDFDLIQNALRMGAIDYIVKTELEEDVIEEWFARIRRQIIAKKGERERAAGRILESRDYGILFVAKGGQDSTVIMKQECFVQKVPVLLEEGNLLYIIAWDEIRQIFSCIRSTDIIKHWCVKGIPDIDRVSRTDLLQCVARFIASDLFYDYREDVYSEINILDNSNMWTSHNLDRHRRLEEEWSDLLWVLDEKEFQRICTETVKLRPDKDRLIRILCHAMDEWYNCFYFQISEIFYEELENVRFWEDYRKLAERLRKHIMSQLHLGEYSEEIIFQIVKAIKYVKLNYDNDINQEELIKIFSISRSYFSKAFKDIFGVTYQVFYRNFKLEKAKILLETTDEKVYQIAEKVGFTDERYFSRIFRENIGMLPSEYRSQKGQYDCVRN